MPPQVPSFLKPGDRIQVDDNISTIRYIGAVDASDGEWLGVEWDDASRGKHSGEKDGRSYFTCRYMSVCTHQCVQTVDINLSLDQVPRSRLVHPLQPKARPPRHNATSCNKGKVPPVESRDPSEGIRP